MHSRFDNLMSNLTEILLPDYISSYHCDIFEETLLTAAGVAAKPTECGFGLKEDNNEVMCFRIKGLSDDDAKKFLSFLKETSQDETAHVNYVPSESFIPKEFHDSHYFEINQAKVNENLLPIFEQEYQKLSKDKLDAYRKQCENSQQILNLKARLKKFVKNHLFQELESLLTPELISTHSHIFENTLLKIAGVESLVPECDFDVIDHEQISFTIGEISDQDADKFLMFLKETCGDPSATKELADKTEYVLQFNKKLQNKNKLATAGEFIISSSSDDKSSSEDELSHNLRRDYQSLDNNSEDEFGDDESSDDEYVAIHNSYLFKVGTASVIEQALPRFKEAFLKISDEKRDEYRRQSVNDTVVCFYKRANSLANWYNVYQELENFLNPLLMTTEASIPIFEETLLSLAGIETKPQKCEFGLLKSDGIMFFNFAGLSDEEAEKFLAFLQKNGDAAAKRNFDEINKRHHFEVSTKIVLMILLPQFMDEIIRLEKAASHKLADYKKQSENHPDVITFKLNSLFSEIMKLVAELKSKNIDDLIKAQLNILFLALEPAIKTYEYHRKQHFDTTGESAKKMKWASELLESTCDLNEPLKKDETVQKLRVDVKDYNSKASSERKNIDVEGNVGEVKAALTQIFGLFGGFNTGPQNTTNESNDEIDNNLKDDIKMFIQGL